MVLASGNSGKLREMRDILSGTGMALLPLGEFTGESPEETGEPDHGAIKSGATGTSGKPVQVIQQQTDIRLIIRARAGVAGGTHARRTPQSFDHQPRIIGQRR